MKTEWELLDLKTQWKADPCWDIEDTEGFEEHRTELLIWKLTHERDEYRIKLDQLLAALRVIDRVIHPGEKA